MIPIRDTIRSSHHPVVTTAIIGVNVALYLVQLAQGAELDRFIFIYGLVPARYTDSFLSAYFSTAQQVLSLLTFMFLHGGFWHLLGNMWSLYIFGDNVENRLGPLRYLLFYLLCGLVSGLTHLMFNPLSRVPTIGASGAIAGVMGAYFILFPHAKILTLIPIIFIPWFIEIPAFFFLAFWFVMQFLNAAGSRADMGGIAWWAHIGGFISGVILLKVLGRLPATGVTERFGRLTTRKTSPRLQVIYPVNAGAGDDPHLYGQIRVTAREAAAGTRKMVNIPLGFRKRMFRVIVPPGMQAGSLLRLRALGKELPDGSRGDLFLKVVIEA